MTTKFLTIQFAKFPNFIVMEFPRNKQRFGQFSVNFPLPNPLQNANFINIVLSVSLKMLEFPREGMNLRKCAVSVKICVLGLFLSS